MVPFAAIQAVPIAVIAWYRLQRYAWYRYSAIVNKLTGVSRKLEFNGVQTDNMGALGYGVFFGCRKLTDLTIPANVTVINEVVFQDCNLQNVTFADATKITEIQKYAFTNNPNLTGLFADKHFDNLKTIEIGRAHV